MEKHIRNIRRAVKNNANLKEAVNHALASITKSSDLENLLDDLGEVAFKNPRYLEVYDLLHKHFPQNALIMVSKSLACRPRHCNESVDALIKALVILHQTDEDYSLIRICYESLGVNYFQLSQPRQAIAAYTLAMSYYNPQKDHFQHAFHFSLYNRAWLYLQENRHNLAKRDVNFFLSRCPQDPYFSDLLKQIEDEQVELK